MKTSYTLTLATLVALSAHLTHSYNPADLERAQKYSEQSFFIRVLSPDQRISLDNLDLSDADLSSLELTYADLTNTNLSNVNTGDKFGLNRLNGANLTGANLSGRALACPLDYSECYQGTNFNQTNLTNATLENTDLSSSINLDKAIFNNTRYDSRIKFPAGFNPKHYPGLIPLAHYTWDDSDSDSD